jgi:hypothetical protein
MISSIRAEYNRAFTSEKYDAFLADVNQLHPGVLGFRICETPVFIPAEFKHRLMDAGEEVLGILEQPDFQKRTRSAIPPGRYVPGQNERPEFIALDFAVCLDGEERPIPRLVELRGFPTINALQPVLASSYQKHFRIPEGFSPYLNGYDENSYWDLLGELILAGHNPREVILLETESDSQKARIDFYLTQDRLGVEPVAVSELEKAGRKLYYRRGKQKIRVRRIYNRLVFEDLGSRGKAARRPAAIARRRMDVEWVSHPNWFFRVSKFLLPLMDSRYVPRAYFLHKLEVIPARLQDYVLRPLSSPAGRGFIAGLTRAGLEGIRDPQRWILQKKVDYAPVVDTPDGKAGCEIRLMYYWKKGAPRPVLAQNLCRLDSAGGPGASSHGTGGWTGTGICFFEQG